MADHVRSEHIATKPALVVFDFDGTLTKIDSFNDFFCWTFGPWAFWSFVALHGLEYVGALFGVVSTRHNKEVLARHFLSKMPEAAFQKLVQKYLTERIPQIVREDIVQLLKIHQVAGDQVVLASASPEDWIVSWAAAQDVAAVIASKFTRQNGRLTGSFTVHTYGKEKLRVLQTLFTLEDFETIHVYTDSQADQALLSIATHQHLV